MSKKGDHHYVSQFHLRNWELADGLITQWSRIAYNGKLVSKRVTSAATAYAPGLYLLEHVNDEEAQQIETKILGEIETQAAPVLDKLISLGPERLTVSERYGWTVYLIASLLRVPHIVEKVKAEASERIKHDLSQEIPEYTAVKGDAPETTLYEWALKNASASVANSGLSILVRPLRSDKAAERIKNLHWLVRDVSSASRRLLFGDNPFERVGDLYKRRTAISLPLSPTHLFIASDAPDIIEHFGRMPARDVIKANHQSTLINAKKFVYGEAQPAFIDRYLLQDQLST